MTSVWKFEAVFPYHSIEQQNILYVKTFCVFIYASYFYSKQLKQYLSFELRVKKLRVQAQQRVLIGLRPILNITKEGFSVSTWTHFHVTQINITN